MVSKKTSKKPKHTHFWEFHSWVQGPKSPKDNYQTWDFVVEYRCSCGKNQKVEPSQEELKQYIKDSTCDYCGELHEQHEQPRECITVLRNKMVGLEERLEKLEDKMNSISNVFKDSVDRDRR